MYTSPGPPFVCLPQFPQLNLDVPRSENVIAHNNHLHIYWVTVLKFFCHFAVEQPPKIAFVLMRYS